ncbi:MAG: hypothetical protein K9K63_16120 [Desulfotignum sp.]|nr:hypothetical protein [Desulfotignum sp.]MCF8138830.1 hypothetical protein [Desulfotignum sp.]
MGILVVFVLLIKIRVCPDAVCNVDEFDPLFIRGGAPSLKPPFIEAADNIIQGVVFLITAVGTPG